MRPARLDPRWDIALMTSPNLNHRRNLATQTIGVGPGGAGFRGSTSTGTCVAGEGRPPAGLQEFTAFCWWNCSGSNEVPLSLERAGSYWQVAFQYYSGAFYFSSRNTTTGEAGASNLMTIATPTTGRDYVHVVTYSVSGNAKTAYVNGAYSSTNTSQVAPLIGTTVYTHMGAGTPYASAGYGFNNWVYMAGYASRVWSPGEIAEFSADPTKVFLRRPPLVYTPMQSAASVSITSALLSASGAALAGSAMSVARPGVLQVTGDSALSAGRIISVDINAPAFSATGAFLGHVQLSCSVLATLTGSVFLDARLADGVVVPNPVLEHLGGLGGGVYLSVAAQGVLPDTVVTLTGGSVIHVSLAPSAFQSVGAIMGTRVVVAPTILSGQHPSVESATAAFSLLTLHDGSTRTWH